MSQCHPSSAILRGQEETQDTEGSVGRKRDALTALSFPGPLCPTCILSSLPRNPSLPSSPVPLKTPAGTPGSATPRRVPIRGLGCRRQEANSHPFLCTEFPVAAQAACRVPGAPDLTLYPGRGMGALLSTPGLGPSPRSHFPPLSSRQAWEKQAAPSLLEDQNKPK